MPVGRRVYFDEENHRDHGPCPVAPVIVEVVIYGDLLRPSGPPVCYRDRDRLLRSAFPRDQAEIQRPEMEPGRIFHYEFQFLAPGIIRAFREVGTLIRNTFQIEKDILMMKKGIREVEFTRFGFIKQLEIVNKYVRIINVDMKSKNVDVVFRDEKKEDEELLNW